jgi:uncharacterized membrane protein YfcA
MLSRRGRIWTVEMLIAAGMVVGLIMGLLGGGGTVVLLPVLVYGVGMSTHEAIATSLVVVGLGAGAATLEHGRAGRVRWRLGMGFGGAAMAGALPGGWAAQFFSAHALMLGFGLMMAVAAVVMLRPQGERQPEAGPIRWGWVVLEGLLVGFFTGLVGAGGGFMIVPALVILGGLEMKEAVGTSLFIMALKSGAALVGQLSHVELNWLSVAVLTAAAVVGSQLGSRGSKWISGAQLKTAFGVLVLLLAVHTLVQEMDIGSDSQVEEVSARLD